MGDDTLRAVLDKAAGLFRAGEILAALAEWEHALALRPGYEPVMRALESLKANYDLLEEKLLPAGQPLDLAELVFEQSDGTEEQEYDLAEFASLPTAEVPGIDALMAMTEADMDTEKRISSAGIDPSTAFELGTRATEELSYDMAKQAVAAGETPAGATDSAVPVEVYDEPTWPVEQSRELRTGLQSEPALADVEERIRADVDRDAPLDETVRARTRRRVKAFIEYARQAHGDGATRRAAIALELAFGEDPDSPITHKQVHSHRDALLAIFADYIADFGARPSLNVSLSELKYQQLESRAAFLLSRIDGTLTVEQLLDIAGMPRVEALRYLTSMVLRGILILAN